MRGADLLSRLAMLLLLGPQDAPGLRDAEGFVRAGPGRPLMLPADHASHPDTRTEWWYLSGSLQGPAGERFGFQATWFRRAVVREVAPDRSPLAVRDVILFHGAVTDVAGGRIAFEEQAARAYAPWAWTSTDRLDVAVYSQHLWDPLGDGRVAQLQMRADEFTLELELDLAASPPLLHGEQPGLSIKGREQGQASWYYSLPAVPVRGRLLRPGNDPLPVTGTAWLDHEFGSSQLESGQEGWDWFSVALDDGSELMLYQLRREGGARDSTSSGTLRLADGTRRHLTESDFRLAPRGSWTSTRTRIRYPSGWVLEVPSAALELNVRPTLDDQELQTPGTTGVTYWEGLCRFEGQRAGRPVRGQGYVELVGYGEPIADRFESAHDRRSRIPP